MPRWVLPRGRARDPLPAWQYPFLIGFTGIRGAVSLAAALAIPLTAGNEPFPDRSLILFATFCLIFVTLIGQGAVLPRLILRLGLAQAGWAEATEDKWHEVAAKIEGVKAVLARLKELAGEDTPDAAIAALRRRHEDRLAEFAGTADERVSGSPVLDNAVFQLQLVDAERTALARRYADGTSTDEARRRSERELDLEDARVRHAAESGVGDWMNADPAAAATEATGPEAG